MPIVLLNNRNSSVGVCSNAVYPLVKRYSCGIRVKFVMVLFNEFLDVSVCSSAERPYGLFHIPSPHSIIVGLTSSQLRLASRY